MGFHKVRVQNKKTRMSLTTIILISFGLRDSSDAFGFTYALHDPIIAECLNRNSKQITTE